MVAPPSQSHLSSPQHLPPHPLLSLDPLHHALLQTPKGSVSRRIFYVDWPLNQVSLTPGAQYFITVQGYNDAGESAGWLGGWLADWLAGWLAGWLRPGVRAMKGSTAGAWGRV